MKRNAGIDRMRLIAAFMVVAIHTYPLENVSEMGEVLFTRVLCRVAVPFFFMVTGFYVLPGCLNGKEGKKKLGGWFRKTGLLYGAAVFLYLPVNGYAGHLKGISLEGILKEILWNGTFYHLWYFPAVLLGMALTIFLLNKLGGKKTFICVLILYAVGLLGDSYYGFAIQAPLLKSFYEWLWQWMDYTRTGLFFAPVFLYMGFLLRKQKSLSAEEAGIGTCICLLLLAAEGLMVHSLSLQRHDSMYLMLVPLLYFLFSWVCGWRSAEVPQMSQMSSVIYLVHPICILAVRGAGNVLGLERLLIENSLVHFAAVAGCSAAIAAVPALCSKGGVFSRSIEKAKKERR